MRPAGRPKRNTQVSDTSDHGSQAQARAPGTEQDPATDDTALQSETMAAIPGVVPEDETGTWNSHDTMQWESLLDASAGKSSEEVERA